MPAWPWQSSVLPGKMSTVRPPHSPHTTVGAALTHGPRHHRTLPEPSMHVCHPAESLSLLQRPWHSCSTAQLREHQRALTQGGVGTPQGPAGASCQQRGSTSALTGAGPAAMARGTGTAKARMVAGHRCARHPQLPGSSAAARSQRIPQQPCPPASAPPAQGSGLGTGLRGAHWSFGASSPQAELQGGSSKSCSPFITCEGSAERCPDKPHVHVMAWVAPGQGTGEPPASCPCCSQDPRPPCRHGPLCSGAGSCGAGETWGSQAGNSTGIHPVQAARLQCADVEVKSYGTSRHSIIHGH